ncbi:related to period clock protein FRQ [Phialocephala subalpina]|uniref:Related to period clock protein FRQ n=1 Tax=Phialocephala subalpina TaxID=576137 RepID=A0A1L7XGL1_9HELO|nr:related to period clock protein FRQ [Phialocephala subalpina]
MLASSTKQQQPTATHPRRLPAHLSVSLRHEGPPTASPAEIGNADTTVGMASGASPARQESEESGKSGESNVEKWFDHSNGRPETGYNPNFEDNEPPFFLPHNSSSTSNNDVPASRLTRQPMPGILQPATNTSSADDFRSVIDDLTIENKKLKERLRRFERLQPPHLEKDKMFELKIHSLSSRKRRELEDLLRDFASSAEESLDGETKRSPNDRPLYPSLNLHLSNSTLNAKHTPSSSTSNSRPNDSAYASMSISGPTSTSAPNQLPLEKADGRQPRVGKEQKIHSFLHNIPEGLLPKHSPVMTERQKKKLVVQRLEQLFTGRRGAKADEHSQPFQQQEVSKSAARADDAARNGPPEEEGAREAHILPMDIDTDGGKLSKLSRNSSGSTIGSRRMISDSSDEQSPERLSPKQRPTRPLDLDPDRAQIPSENVAYIRHLGLSTPQLVTEDSADVAADADGWIYLNLLINMAQLHIINVTPEFVRSALSVVSEKFQLSRDGKKVRWRGGSEGTRLSSDSGASSVRNRSNGDEDHGNRKRRKVEVGRFASAPVEVDNSDIPMKSSRSSSSFHYKPLFHHQNSSSAGVMSTDESDSPFGSGPELDSSSRKLSRGANAWSRASGSGGKRRRRQDEGPIVFYNGAKFCIDLSGDRSNIITPLHISDIGKDGYSNQATVALGARESAPTFARTTSGSFLPFRPFKDYSKSNDPFLTEETRPKTPELFEDESEEEQFVNETPRGSSHVQLQRFEATGLGGIQPADHFAVQVHTRRRKSGRVERSKLSRFSRLSSPGKTPRKFLHGIPKESIDYFHDKSPEETIADRLAAWPGCSSTPRNTIVPVDKLPVKTEILSTRYVNLAPSQLPPPFGWDVSTNSSDGDSDSDSDSDRSSAGISHLRCDRPFLNVSRNRMKDPNDLDLADASDEEDVSGSDTDSNIDMLAQARQLEPDVVLEQEREFAMEVDEDRRRAGSALARSSVATVDDESGYSSAASVAGE